MVDHPPDRNVSISTASDYSQTPQPEYAQDPHIQALARSESHTGNLTRSPTNGTLPRISTDELPEPPSKSLTGKPSNGALQPSPIEEEMALKPGHRPAPLRTDSTTSMRSQSGSDLKKPVTPGNKFTSFFSRKQTASPGNDSAVTDSESKSPMPSPYPDSHDYGFPAPASKPSQDSIDFDPTAYAKSASMDRASALEVELREISKELASSIKREMDLEDMVERLQAEAPSYSNNNADRTSDYFSDSGTSSIRPPTSDFDPKQEMERVKRDAEQQRATMKVEFSQKWQREMATRKAMESHLNYMEQRFSQNKSHEHASQDISSRARELEAALDDTRRRLNEERQTNANFEDLLSALRGDLEQHRNDRDNLRDEVVPQLKSRIEGLESTLADHQKSPYDAARMQHEIQSLRDENQALHSARMMNAPFESIAEEGSMGSPRNSAYGGFGGLQRSTTFTLGRSNSRAGGLNRSNSVSKGSAQDTHNLAESLKQVEVQRDALHSTVRYLLRRQTVQNKQYEKKIKVSEMEKEKAKTQYVKASHKGGYEKEVKVLRAEINLLRKRADDAMEQKWECEKGLAGLKLDLDRSKQETESLQGLLKARDSGAPEVLSEKLERALQQLQQNNSRVSLQASLGQLRDEQNMSSQLEESAERSEALASQVRKQLKANSSLRDRLKVAIEKGEQDQFASAAQINELQGKLQKLQDTITSAQIQSETAVMKHEEEVRLLRASTNLHLLRAKSANPALLSPTPRSPLSPLFANSKRSPRLDKTSSGPGMALHEALKTEYLEKKVGELEKALSEAENEMGEVIGRMNTAQIGVAELEAERLVESISNMTRALTD